MSPREARQSLADGSYILERGLPPEPPPEWHKYRRDSMATCIKAASRFLRGKSLEDIRRMGKLGDISNQRVAFMVNRGIQFFLLRGHLKPKPR